MMLFNVHVPSASLSEWKCGLVAYRLPKSASEMLRCKDLALFRLDQMLESIEKPKKILCRKTPVKCL